jgi:hypothetical protein
LRAVMLVAWTETFGTCQGGLFRWHHLQGRMSQGFRLDDFSEAETRQALAIDPFKT